MATSQDFANWVCGADLEPAFLSWVLQRSKDYILTLASGAIHQTVYMPAIQQFHVLIPPFETQKTIVATLNHQLHWAETITARALAQLEGIKALPAALLRAAFSGQDVGLPVPQMKVAAPPYAVPVGLPLPQSGFRGAVPFQWGMARALCHLVHLKVPGKVRQQKYLYLWQTHLDINLGGRFVRGQYGPFDQSVYDIYRHAETQYWFSSRSTTGEDVFTEGAGIASMLKEAQAAFGESLLLINSLTQLLNELNTKEIEAVATLYAVWNDFILEGHIMPDKEEIVIEAITNWHKDKRMLQKDRLLELLEWMKLHGLEPRGTGQSTKNV
jgi:hypothetical protein